MKIFQLAKILISISLFFIACKSDYIPYQIENVIKKINYHHSQEENDMLTSIEENEMISKVMAGNLNYTTIDIILNDPKLIEYFNKMEITNEKYKFKLVMTTIYRMEKKQKIYWDQQIKEIKYLQKEGKN